MNLVGKIFIVLILIMSVLFMAFAMAIYATQRNWREVVMTPDPPPPGKEVGLRVQLEKANKQGEELKAERDKLQQDRDTERAAKIEAVKKLQNELDLKKADLARLEKQQADLEKDRREAVATMNTTQANAARDRKEVDTQRTALNEARKDRDAHFNEVVRLTEELNQAVNDKEQLRKRMLELGKDLAKAKDVLRHHNLNLNEDLAATPPRVAGQVLATPGEGLVEISLGSDQGLRKGHLLEVYRTGAGQNTYVGRIEVVRTAPDKSVCKIDPKFQNSNVMVGDSVASKID